MGGEVGGEGGGGVGARFLLGRKTAGSECLQGSTNQLPKATVPFYLCYLLSKCHCDHVFSLPLLYVTRASLRSCKLVGAPA